MWAKYRGAKRIFSIDCIEERLAKARSQGAETIDFSKTNVIDAMQKMLPGQIRIFLLYKYTITLLNRWS
jgi:threonine dehydrogenase-like Zn-dependent dehydrogenase